MQTKMFTAVIADDEPLLIEELRSLLEDLWPDLLIVGVAGDGAAALQMIESMRPDVCFLDIRMPKMSGLELAERIQGMTHIVFVTAYEAHAVSAFEQGAVDYLLKPVTHLRLSTALTRIRERLQHGPAKETDAPAREALQWIQASAGNTLRFFHLPEILYLRSDNKYTRIVALDTEGFVRKSLIEFQRILDTANFWQINRGILVNARHIDAVVRNADGDMSLQLRGHTDVLPISKAHQGQFRGW
ncbi:MAG: LytTR family DNA-binding domain-containing protein [Pseudomonadota bacterium]